jgi:hypothetical protein
MTKTILHRNPARIQEKLPSGEPEKSLVSPGFQCRIFAGFLSPPPIGVRTREAHIVNCQPINIFYRQSESKKAMASRQHKTQQSTIEESKSEQAARERREREREVWRS